MSSAFKAAGRIPARVRWEIKKVRKRGAHADARRLWVRQVMDQEVAELIAALGPADLDAVEISGNLHGHWPWRSYETLEYPDFDLCDPGTVEPAGDVVICEQVLEHVTDPLRAAGTLYEVCRPGGHVIVSTPFLLRVHNQPGDYWRFTMPALRRLLEGGGLEVIDVGSWGNRACVRANLTYWRVYRPWHSLTNEPDLPVVVWAIARRPIA